MKLDNFITKVVDIGIAAARVDYAKHPIKLRGAIAGFEACRNLDLESLALLLKSTRTATLAARDVPDTYWWFRCYELEVEWVCNCVSATLVQSGKEPIIPPTHRGMLLAMKIFQEASENG